MGIAPPFDTPFYQGAQVAADTPYYLPVSIGSRSYLIDLSKYKRSTIPPTRPPSDTATEPGDWSLDQGGLWRRSAQSFHLGAGQEYFDDAESTRLRYYSSKGVNPFVRKHLSLLNDTQNKRASGNTNLKTILVGTRLYIVDGEYLYFTATPTDAVWTVAANLIDSTARVAGQSIVSVTTDGAKVWAAAGTTGIRETVAGATTATTLVAGTFTLVGYANERLIAANGNILYEVSRGGVLTTIWTHPNPNFVWTAVIPAPNAIYIAGTCVDRSTVYGVTNLDATGALAPPVIAASLPNGETINTMQYYGGTIIFGTSRGLRLGTIGHNASISYGPAINIVNGIQAMDGQGEYIWFAWSNYDATSTGLGRADLSNFTSELAPAYASDLMATAQGTVQSVASYAGKRYFAISGVGFFGEMSQLVPSGVLNTGKIRYGTTEKKAATSIDVRHDPLPNGDSIQASIVTEDTSINGVGQSDVPGTLSPTSPLSMSFIRAEWYQVQFTLSRYGRTVTDGATNSNTTVTSATAAFTSSDVGRVITGGSIPPGATILSITNATTVVISAAATTTATAVTITVADVKGPVMGRWTLYARVTPILSDQILVPLIVKDYVRSESGEGLRIPHNPLAEYLFLKNLADTKALQVYQEGSLSWTVYVAGVEVMPEDWSADRSFFNGIIMVTLVTVTVV